MKSLFRFQFDGNKQCTNHVKFGKRADHKHIYKYKTLFMSQQLEIWKQRNL